MRDPFDEERPHLPWTTLGNDKGVTREELEIRNHIMAYLQTIIGSILLGILVHFQ